MTAKAKLKDQPDLLSASSVETKAETPPATKETKPRKSQAVAKVERLPPPATPANMLAIIANAAANKDVDVEKMRALLDMQREIMTEAARIAFTEDFIAMELPSVN